MVQIWCTEFGGWFAVLTDGKILVWGEENHGGRLPATTKQKLEQTGIERVWCSWGAFVVLLKNGEFVAWGKEGCGAELPDATKQQLEQTGVERVWPSGFSFFALLKSGGVVVWGNQYDGTAQIPDVTKQQLEQVGIERVWSASHAFLVLLKSGEIVAWGDEERGGKLPAATKQQLEQAGIEQVWSTEEAFLALLRSGEVVAWGCTSRNFELLAATKQQLEEGCVEQVWPTRNAFFVRLKSGKIVDVQMGETYTQDIASAQKQQLEQGRLEQVWSAGFSFFARLGSGDVVAWGSADYIEKSGGGGRTRPTIFEGLRASTKQLLEQEGIVQVWGTNKQFVARLRNCQFVNSEKRAFGSGDERIPDDIQTHLQADVDIFVAMVAVQNRSITVTSASGELVIQIGQPAEGTITLSDVRAAIAQARQCHFTEIKLVSEEGVVMDGPETTILVEADHPLTRQDAT